MNRKTADRIIVKSNARTKMVLDWYYENKHWLDREPFLAPMESGVVELCEEQIEFTFENTRGVVEIAIYPTVQPNIPASIVFDYLPEQMDIANRRVAPELVEPKRLALDLVLRYDKTPEKEALKYHALMLFMTYYREVIEVEQRVEHRPARCRRPEKTSASHKAETPCGASPGTAPPGLMMAGQKGTYIMKLNETKDWKAVHFEGRTILRSDRNLYPEADWWALVSSVEVEPMKQPGHYKAV